VLKRRLYVEVDIDFLQLEDLLEQIRDYVHYKGLSPAKPIVNSAFYVPVGKIEIRQEVRKLEL